MVMLRIRFLLVSTLALNLVSSAKAATSSLPAATLPSPILVINNEPNFTYDELYKLLTEFWENFLYPADVTQAKSINLTILSENVLYGGELMLREPLPAVNSTPSISSVSLQISQPRVPLVF
jgi:hypothetical protein